MWNVECGMWNVELTLNMFRWMFFVNSKDKPDCSAILKILSCNLIRLKEKTWMYYVVRRYRQLELLMINFVLTFISHSILFLSSCCQSHFHNVKTQIKISYRQT